MAWSVGGRIFYIGVIFVTKCISPACYICPRKRDGPLPLVSHQSLFFDEKPLKE